MAMANDLNNEISGLARMSLDDFLQEDIPLPCQTNDSAVLYQPFPIHWEREKWAVDDYQRHRYKGYGGRGGGSVRGGRSHFRHPKKDGLKTGVLMSHDQPPRQPLINKNPVSRPMESILTIGTHEAQSVKEKVNSAVEGDLEIDLEAVLTNALPQHEVNFILGQTVKVKKGQQCHFLPVQNLGHVRRNTVLKLLVGMLNTGQRGVIYMGISENGCVDGINAEPHIINQFVEGLMKTVQFYLMPRLHTPQYGVRYTNVVTTSGQLLNNMWLVELHAVPQMQHYYNPVMDLNYYIRHGSETKMLPFEEFCQTIVAETSKNFQPEIQKLEDKIKHLQDTLHAKGIDTSSVETPHLCQDCFLNDCPDQCFGKSLVKENM